MADRPNTIQFLLTEHGIDSAQASGLECPAGRVLVEMLPEAQRIGQVLLPGRVAANLRPDIGVVLSVGPGVLLEPGAMVAVRPYNGQWIEGFDVPGYRTKNQVRFYGRYTAFQGDSQELEWDESILVRIFPEEESMQAVGRNLILRREPIVREQGGLVLPDDEHYHTGLATVESVGPKCELETASGPIGVGDLVHYDTRSVVSYDFKSGYEDYAIVPDIGINCVIRNGE
jgi:co-chaperonin GroES (HSP10)